MAKTIGLYQPSKRATLKPFRDYSDFLADHFDHKVQKLTLNAGFSCPNRDGTVGWGGCSYCNNQTFNPSYCEKSKSITQQLEEGKTFFAKKYPSMRYLAYFQAYTNTHGDVEKLLKLYNEALAVDGIDGIIVATRPDSMPQELLECMATLARNGQFVMIEYGAESSHNETLRRVNRCHTWEQTVDAVERTAAIGIPVGLHLINGLPGESENDILHTVDAVNLLPVDTVKFHQLQLVKGTRLAAEVASGQTILETWTVERYIALCSKIVERLRRDIAIERFVSQSPDDLLISPRWGLKNYQFTNLLHNALTTLRK